MASETTGVPTIGEPTQHGPELDINSPLPSPTSTASAASDDEPRSNPNRLSRPKLGSRKSSGTIIVPRDASPVEDESIDEGDVRSMSPRRNSDEVEKLGEEARKELIEQSKTLQASLQAIVDRVETVKVEHEKLEGGNKFLQS